MSQGAGSYVLRKDRAWTRQDHLKRWNHEQHADEGRHPREQAEILGLPKPLDAVGRRYQGGSFASADFTPPDQRPTAG